MEQDAPELTVDDVAGWSRDRVEWNKVDLAAEQMLVAGWSRDRVEWNPALNWNDAR